MPGGREYTGLRGRDRNKVKFSKWGFYFKAGKKAAELHEEVEGRCQQPQGEGARKYEPTSGVGEGLEKQGGGCLASSSFRR